MSAPVLIVIPTHAHALLLPFAVESALAQSVTDIEVVVVGDGVGDDTRAALAPLVRRDERLRFVDHPKRGPRGEASRHEAIIESSAELITYLSDDDLLLPHHVADVVAHAAAGADFISGFPACIDADGTVDAWTVDLAGRRYRRDILRGRISWAGVTAAAHTRSAYERSGGWRETPPGKLSDLHMWQAILSDPACRAMTATRPTALAFPSIRRTGMSDEARRDELATWAAAAAAPDFYASFLERVIAAHMARAVRMDDITSRVLARSPLRPLRAWRRMQAARRAR